MKKVISFFAAVLVGCLIQNVASAHGGGAHPPLTGHLPFKNNTLHVHASLPNPPAVGTGSVVVLETKDAKTHQNVEITDNVEVALFMPAMGHGSAPTQVERVLDASGNIQPGVYNVKNVYFTMAGDWEVRVTLTDEKGISETQKFDVKLDGEHGGHQH